MSKALDEWAMFVGSKKRTTKTHYDQGRLCRRCKAPITNHNISGLCYECYKINKDYKPRTKAKSHDKLKEKAAGFLKGYGCEDITKEKTVIIDIFKNKKFIIDVAGYKDKKLIAVECGGSQHRKLQSMINFVGELYIWPYGYDFPFRYDKSNVICSLCGNLVDNI